MIDAAFLRRITAPQLLAQQEAFTSVQYCLTPSCTETNFSWCHTISEASQLDFISEERKGKKQVAWIPLRESDRWKQGAWWEDISKSRALVFRGFCANCDSNIFRDIDGQLEQTKKTFALMAYRCACYAKWRADVDNKAHDLLKEKLIEKIDRDNHTADATSQSTDQKSLSIIGEKLRIQNLLATQYQSRLEEIVSGRTFDSINTACIEFNERVPFRFTMAGSFTTDIRMNPVEILASDCIATPMYFMSIQDFGDKSTLVVSSPIEIPDKYLIKFMNELFKLSLSGHLTDVLLRFMINNNQGLIFRPSFIDFLGHEAISYLFGSVSGKFYFGLEESVTRVCYPPHLNEWSLKLKES